MFFIQFVVVGSSPRTWGIRSDCRLRGLRLRFIPTNVGNTELTGALNKADAVHPHERGEYFDGLEAAPSRFGSSPRTWGIRFFFQAHLRVGRFIPTNVGNTGLQCHRSGRGSVHPHERGEYRRQVQQVRLDLRFIPTNVGNTSPLP